VSRRVTAVAAALLLIGAPAPAWAAAARCPKTSLADVEDEVMCLVCGVPLALADAPQAERERALVTSMVRGCRSKDEIESALVAQYGPRVLALPKASGFRLVAYVVPGLAAAAVAVGLAVAATRWRRHPRAGPGELVTDRPPLEPLHAARIDAELDRYRR
jgi:cytochrome c-type biogenesis protein CcmH